MEGFSKRKRNTVQYKHHANTNIHRTMLGHGDVCIMASDPNNGPEHSFQRLAMHQVPVAKKSKGARLNWTIRTSRMDIPNPILIDWEQRVDVGEGLWLLLSTWPLESTKLHDLYEELLLQMSQHGTPDETTVFGKTFTNNGRKVLELSHEAGHTYTYSGKTTAPGQAYGPIARSVLEYLSNVVFRGAVTVEEMWSHLVFYPNPQECKLSWHSDSENGVNPHCIMSVTFLDDPIMGPRPFDVRLKSAMKK